MSPLRQSPRPRPHAPVAREAKSGITPAERRVLTLVLQGASNATIASSLAISRRTVEGHVSALLQKTGCRSRTQLVLWALNQG